MRYVLAVAILAFTLFSMGAAPNTHMPLIITTGVTPTATPEPTPTAEPTKAPNPNEFRDGFYQSSTNSPLDFAYFYIENNGTQARGAGYVLYRGGSCGVFTYEFPNTAPVVNGAFEFRSPGGSYYMRCAATSSSAATCRFAHRTQYEGSCGLGSGQAIWRWD